MKRRSFFRSAGLAIATASIVQRPHTQGAPMAPALPPKSFTFASAPVLMNPAPDGISIVCAVNAPATGWIEYGENETLGQRCTGSAQGFLPYEAKALRFRLEGLKPGKQYFYRVHAVAVNFESPYKATRGAEIVTDVRGFKTLNPEAAMANFTVWNDTHQDTETLRKLIALHRSDPGDFLVWNGDVTNDIINEELLINEYLHPARLAHADSTPVFLSRGNHDVRGEAARMLSHYAPGPGGTYHYIFRQGPVGVLVLDTGEDKPDNTPVYAGINDFAAHRAAQRRWLERAIEDPDFKSAPFRIACMHIPLFWEAEVPEKWLKVWGGFNGWICEDGRNQWHDLLEKAGVRLVISGHTHRHAWFPPNAAHSYGQLIGGGPKPELATVIRVEADSKNLQVTAKNLAGEILVREQFKA